MAKKQSAKQAKFFSKKNKKASDKGNMTVGTKKKKGKKGGKAY